MRVLFVGNVWDYSAGFLRMLSARSSTPSDPITLVGVVCPTGLGTRSAKRWFAAKRQVESAIDLVPQDWLPEGLRHRLKRHQAGFAPEAQRLAREARARLFWPRRITDDDFLERVAALEADVGIVAGLNQIVKGRAFAQLPPLFNVHPSLLPAFRGPAPEYWQLDTGALEGGVTIHRLDPGVDTGPIALQRRFVIEPWLDVDSLVAKNVEVGVALVHEFLNGYPDNAQHLVTQRGGSHQPKPTDADHGVPFERTANGVFDRARAVGFQSPLWLLAPRAAWRNGGPMHCLLEPSPHTLRLAVSDPVPFSRAAPEAPGTLTRVGEGIVVACATGAVLFRRARVHASRTTESAPASTGTRVIAEHPTPASKASDPPRRVPA